MRWRLNKSSRWWFVVLLLFAGALWARILWAQDMSDSNMKSNLQISDLEQLQSLPSQISDWESWDEASKIFMENLLKLVTLWDKLSPLADQLGSSLEDFPSSIEKLIAQLKSFEEQLKTERENHLKTETVLILRAEKAEKDLNTWKMIGITSSIIATISFVLIVLHALNVIK